ncbi:MAG TPA: YegS/Rv2252/BmrU family lipid kinase, partial [Actinomycetota bacterium]|nr:YegS/Rv2252/BmrU family lipid kinase [Actinomycetota bacterium]
EPAWLETTPEDPGRGQAAKAVEDGAELVFVCGGDGTVMAVVTALAGTDVALAVLPAGTGNLLATNFDIPSDPAEAVEIALEGDRVRLDVAAMDDDRFVVMGGIGFDAAMLRDADPKLKEHLGAVAYVLSGFKHLRRRATRFHLRLDDRPPIDRTSQGIVIGNLGRLQGGLPVMPDAQPDDGLLDVAVLQTRTMLDWLALAVRVVARRRRKDPQLELFQARRIEIDWDRPQPVERDGDPAGARDHLVVEVVPNARTLCVPPEKGSTR